MGANTTPRQFILFPDPKFSGPSVVSSVTSEGGKFTGQPVPSSDNEGDLLPYTDGDPDSDLPIQYRVRQTGGLYSGTWAWRDSTNTGGLMGQSDIRYLDHPVAPFRDDEDYGYGLAVAYSSVFKRVLFFRLETSGSATPAIAIRYHDMEADSNPRGFSSTSFTPVRWHTTDGRANMVVWELADGAMRMLLQIAPDASALTDHDFDEYVSLDGGLTWDRIHREIFQQFGMPIREYVSPRGGRSGDWIRIGMVDLDNANKVRTIVSSDRGATWADLGLGDALDDNGDAYDQYSYDILGLGDAYGSFLKVECRDDYRPVFYTATGDQAWQELVDFNDEEAVDPLFFFTGDDLVVERRILRVSLAVDEQRVYAFAWYIRTDFPGRMGFIMRSCRLDQYTDIAKWSAPNGENVEELFPAFDGNARFWPANIHNVFAGHRIVFLAALIDAEDNGTIEPYTVAWHHGGWSQRSFARERGHLGIASGVNLFDEEWLVLFGRPGGNPSVVEAATYSRWSYSETGIVTVDWKPERMRVVGAGTSAVAYWTMNYGAAPVTEWGNASAFFWTCSVPYCGDAAASAKAAARFQLLSGSLGTTVDLSVRYRASSGQTRVVFYDEGAGTTLYASGNLEFDVRPYEWRLGIQDNGSATKVELAWKNLGSMTWSESGQFSAERNAAGVVSQAVKFGILDGSSDGITTEWIDFRIAGTSNLAQIGYSAGQDMTGRACSPNPVYVYRGISARWGGGGGFVGDEYDTENQYADGTVNLFLPSPALQMRTTSGATQSMVFDAGTSQVWVHDGIGMINCQVEQAIVQYSDNANFISLVATETVSFQTLSAVANTVTMSKGDLVRFQTGSPIRQQFCIGELEGYYVRKGSGVAPPSFRVTKHLGAEVQANGSVTDMASVGFTTGDLGKVISPDVVHVYSDRHIARYMKVTLPSPNGLLQGANLSNLFALGAMVPGTTHPVSVPFDWVHGDAETANVEVTETPNGQRLSFVRGDPRRRIEARIVGDVSEYRQELRGLLRQLADYNDRCVVLVLDDQELTRHSKIIYGRVDGKTDLDQQGWYQDAYGRNLTIGDLAFSIDEER